MIYIGVNGWGSGGWGVGGRGMDVFRNANLGSLIATVVIMDGDSDRRLAHIQVELAV